MEEYVFIWHNKTSDIELSEQRIPQVLSEQLIAAAMKLMVFRKIFAKFRSIYFREKVCNIQPKFSHFLRNECGNPSFEPMLKVGFNRFYKLSSSFQTINYNFTLKGTIHKIWSYFPFKISV